MYTDLDLDGFYGLPRLKLGSVDGALGPLDKLNVIVGENSSGKTGLLKLLYAVVKGHERFRNDKISTDPDFANALSDKVFNTFMPRFKGLADIVTKGTTKLSMKASMLGEDNHTMRLAFTIGAESKKTILIQENQLDNTYSHTAIFLPAKEVLTILDAITFTREEKSYPDFDDTYFDLVKSLRIRTTQGNIHAEIRGVSKTLEGVFKGKIVQQFEGSEYKYLYKNGNQKYAMQQTAEGIKKIGILTTLINNRVLNKDTILFIDEPETALHPKAQRELVRILQKISKLSGAQVFIATHSYYIINQLHIVAKEHKQRVPCISIASDEQQERSYRYYDLQKLMPNIPIMEEALAMQSEELALLMKMNAKNNKSASLPEEWN